MTALRTLIERLTKVGEPSETVPAPESEVMTELRALRARIPQLTGSLVASADGLLVAHDLPPSVEPSGMAAVTASGLSLAHRIAQTAHGGAFHEVVIRGVDGYVVTYSSGPDASLTVLAGPGVNVGRLHLECRPAARAIADHLTATSTRSAVSPSGGRE
ncbi:roadblock/LC7 domain-containing protein [Actinomadura macra]|uniref:roadblock/LC7 domain-containing protein n=1 Tax=Actinomadura macra TaxID=46164 RepID=UPI000836919B|nr:roadblock/LC7 domain-containing protein [Actinomadura macra]